MKVDVKNKSEVEVLDELIKGSNLLSAYNVYNPTGTNDTFYERYTFYTTLCNNENTYYVYDHLGNTRITYTPTVMPDGLKFTLNGVYDYYPYGKILREYVQGPQESTSPPTTNVMKKPASITAVPVFMIVMLPGF